MQNSTGILNSNSDYDRQRKCHNGQLNQYRKLTLIVACNAARMASLSACLLMTAVRVDFLTILSPSPPSSGASCCCSTESWFFIFSASSLESSSSFDSTFFFFFFFFANVFPGYINRFFGRALSKKTQPLDIPTPLKFFKQSTKLILKLNLSSASLFSASSSGSGSYQQLKKNQINNRILGSSLFFFFYIY